MICALRDECPLYWYFALWKIHESWYPANSVDTSCETVRDSQCDTSIIDPRARVRVLETTESWTASGGEVRIDDILVAARSTVGGYDRLCPVAVTGYNRVRS